MEPRKQWHLKQGRWRCEPREESEETAQPVKCSLCSEFGLQNPCEKQSPWVTTCNPSARKGKTGTVDPWLASVANQ